jgi:hypothetical protein
MEAKLLHVLTIYRTQGLPKFCWRFNGSLGPLGLNKSIKMQLTCGFLPLIAACLKKQAGLS